MEINSFVTINFIDFIKTGRFGRLKIGQTKKAVLELFPQSESAYEDDVWYYGSIELHFRRNMLSVIYCEDLSAPLGNEDLDITNWFFEDFNNNLLVMMETLTRHDIQHKVKYHKDYPHQCDLEITNSGVRLGFVDYEEINSDPHNLYLNDFSYSKLHIL